MTKKHWLMRDLEDGKATLGVVGLGYVGLPLAVSFARKMKVAGFDISERKIRELKAGVDTTHEVHDLLLLKLPSLSFSGDPSCLCDCNAIIVAVPTPVDQGNKPDLTPLLGASRSVGKILKARVAAHKTTPVYICFESTVYPGCTEEDCIPLIEQESGCAHGKDFYIGYSPERINPGDQIHRFETIKKVVSGCCDDSKEFFCQLYSSVVEAGVFAASSIRVAEAAKVIENSQRDINIAFVNELAVIFSRLGIDTHDVLAAASTKWNFLPFRPGLVGGHCIGVDPYYLTYKAESVGYNPRVILSGRGVNDSMAAFVATEAVKRTVCRPPKNGKCYRALVMGFTFKENCPDIRNTKVVDVVRALKEFAFDVDVTDPVGDAEEARHEYGISLSSEAPRSFEMHDLVVVAVGHDEYVCQLPAMVSETKKSTNALKTTIVDIKWLMGEHEISQICADGSIEYWRL